MPKTTNLALKYRPKRLEDLVGQRSVQVFLSKMVEDDKVPSVMLFKGAYGSGKTSTARILAACLNCESDKPPCTECPTCTSIFDGINNSVMEIDAASNGRVENIRELRERILFDSGGKTNVVILDEVHM